MMAVAVVAHDQRWPAAAAGPAPLALDPPRQLRPRAATASQPGDAAENVSTVT